MIATFVVNMVVMFGMIYLSSVGLKTVIHNLKNKPQRRIIRRRRRKVVDGGIIYNEAPDQHRPLARIVY